MKILHSGTNRRLDDEAKIYSHEEASDLLRMLSSPDAAMITTLPCGIGLDFHALEDGRVWLEFYADGLHAATVSAEVALKVCARAYFLPTLLDPKKEFADLISSWDY